MRLPRPLPGVVDSQTCHDSVDLAGSTSFQAILDGVEDGTIEYDEDKAGACADSFRDQACEFAGLSGEPSPCDDVFTGTVPAGGACVVDLQCANSGDCIATDPNCDPDAACCASTCVVRTEMVSQAGGPCADDIHVCADDLYCRQVSQTAAMCEPLITQEGTACETLSACANPMYCNLDLFGSGRPATCKRPAASGTACDLEDLLPCVDNRDFCDPTSLTCVRGVAPGATCGMGVACVPYASCIDNACVADIARGGACVVEQGADCAGDLECISGTCELPPPGMVCSL